MNREILFRGKRVDNGEWVYGDLANETSGIFIIWIYKPSSSPFSFRNFKDMVIPETVGQFTGLTDKNGTKIFEGDRMIWEIGGEKINVVAVFQEGKFGGRIESYHHISHHIELSYLAITSNIHDNPTT